MSSGTQKDSFFEDVVNPYMNELKMHPKELLLVDGELQIKDVQGPKGEGSLEDRMEKLEQEVFNYKKMAEREVDIFHKIVSELIDGHKKETAKLWDDIFSLHDTTNKLQAQLYDVHNQNYDGGSQKGEKRGPKVGPDHRAARPMAWPRHCGVGAPHPLSPPFLRVLLRPENLSHEGTSRRVTAASAGRRTPREKSALRRAGIRRGNSLPEGEIDAIAIVIELDIISIIIIIIIIIISTIYTVITTAAPRHRCNNLVVIVATWENNHEDGAIDLDATPTMMEIMPVDDGDHIMASPSINFNQFLEKEKLKSNGSNFTDWFRHVRIFLNGGNLQFVLEAPLGPPPPPAVSEDVKNVYETRVTRYSQVQCAILCSLEAELQKCFEHHDPCEMIRELKVIFETHAAVESYEASKQFFGCMMEEGSSVSEHVFAMSGHAKKLSDAIKQLWSSYCINRCLCAQPNSFSKKHQKDKSEGKIFFCKNRTFLENEFLTKEVTGRKVELDEVIEPSLVDQSSAVPEDVPVQPTPIREEANDNDHETSNEVATEPRRSTRERTTPDWYDPCLNVMIVDNNDEDPATYEEAMMSPDSNKWQEAMKYEMGSMYDNKVWTLVDLPDSRKAVENKWIFKRKTDADGNITVYKARLVAKGFQQIQGVDYDETFSAVAKLKSVRILLAIAAFFDYEIWQMDVKTAFLNGDIEEELYMVQPKGFVDLEMLTRPDIAHVVSLTSKYQSDPGLEHWTTVKNIMKYLKRTKDMFLYYGGDQELVVTSYTDASWNTDPDDSKSQSGYVFILNGAAVSWCSSKQCTVAKSSTESEYIAASEASSEAVWMKRFIVELGVVPSALDPLVIYCDNMGAIANAQEPRSHKKLKHIKLHSIREYIEDGEVLEGSRKVRKKSPWKVESRKDSTKLGRPAKGRRSPRWTPPKGAGHPIKEREESHPK
ncbi:hypothetical protein QYE76_066581 [Lolium multiflorum]|uniref:Reverse transcriptase Ty1/copia-type domain-containing protein n=1 Tax=Lolium multiflorum TaxID=4521 RepID=A0AAD8SCC4_LOLMU|nr:hypothetical protein QYE76_066581 [Lolium multiflorum]